MQIKYLIILKKVKPINQNSLDKLYNLGNNTFIQMEKYAKYNKRLPHMIKTRHELSTHMKHNTEFDLQSLLLYSTNDSTI